MVCVFNHPNFKVYAFTDRVSDQMPDKQGEQTKHGFRSSGHDSFQPNTTAQAAPLYYLHNELLLPLPYPRQVLAATSNVQFSEVQKRVQIITKQPR